MPFYKNAGLAVITKDHADNPVVHTGRAADMLRLVITLLEQIAALGLTHGQLVVDFGSTEAQGHLTQHTPKVKFERA